MTESAQNASRRARVERLLEAARVLADPKRSEGAALRHHLLETSGSSAAMVEYGLSRCLETHPREEDVERLLQSTPVSPRAHVLLSANVFVAALRAIALGVASSPSVAVRASRRDPVLAQALHDLAPDLFELVPALAPQPDDHFWAYGSDETLHELRGSLPAGVWFHSHGSGIGAIVLDANAFDDADAQAIALDTALFDQRGCLSPRVVCVLGSDDQARSCARALARALADLELELPFGRRSAAEMAEQRRFQDACTYAFELFEAGSGFVTLSSRFTLSPVGRNLHVCTPRSATQALAAVAGLLTCIACNTPALRAEMSAVFARARIVALGDMQRPPLDGPVDRRSGPVGQRLP